MADYRRFADENLRALPTPGGSKADNSPFSDDRDACDPTQDLIRAQPPRLEVSFSKTRSGPLTRSRSFRSPTKQHAPHVSTDWDELILQREERIVVLERENAALKNSIASLSDQLTIQTAQTELYRRRAAAAARDLAQHRDSNQGLAAEIARLKDAAAKLGTGNKDETPRGDRNTSDVESFQSPHAERALLEEEARAARTAQTDAEVALLAKVSSLDGERKERVRLERALEKTRTERDALRGQVEHVTQRLRVAQIRLAVADGSSPSIAHDAEVDALLDDIDGASKGWAKRLEPLRAQLAAREVVHAALQKAVAADHRRELSVALQTRDAESKSVYEKYKGALERELRSSRDEAHSLDAAARERGVDGDAKVVAARAAGSALARAALREADAATESLARRLEEWQRDIAALEGRLKREADRAAAAARARELYEGRVEATIAALKKRCDRADGAAKSYDAAALDLENQLSAIEISHRELRREHDRTLAQLAARDEELRVALERIEESDWKIQDLTLRIEDAQDLALRSMASEKPSDDPEGEQQTRRTEQERRAGPVAQPSPDRALVKRLAFERDAVMKSLAELQAAYNKATGSACDR